VRRSLILSLTSCLGLFLFAPVPGAFSQDIANEPLLFDGSPPDSALAEVLRDLPGRPLTLEETLRLASEASPELGMARAALKIATADVQVQKGLYDPELFAEFRVEDTETPNASPFAGADIVEERATVTSFGARTRLGLGTEIEASIDTRKSETNDTFSLLEPRYTTFGQLEVRQPLLAGFGPSTRSPLSAAEHSLQAEEWRANDAALRVREQAETLYWELLGAERDFAVQTLVARRAASFLRQAELRAEAGVIGPNQVATAEVFLAQQRLALLDREEELDAASDDLAELIGTRPIREGRFRTVSDLETLLEDVAPTTGDVSPTERRSLSDVLGSGLDEEMFVERVLEANANLRAARADLDAFLARANGARWGSLPQLDLVGSVGGNGLSGRPQTIDFNGEILSTSIDGGLGDALRESVGLDHHAWNLGVEFSFPLGLREERGQRNRWDGEVWRQEQQILEVRHQTESAARDALRRLRHGGERLRLARMAVAAAEEQIRIGLIEFANGRNTAFELVRLGEDFASTQRELSRAVVGTATARAELKQLMGTGFEGE